MTPRYFLEIAGDVVKQKLEVFSAGPREVPPALREVTAEVFASVQEGATANPNGTYTAPTPPPVRRISRHDFLNLLTPQEEIALERLAYLSGTPEQAATAAAVRVWQRRLEVASYIDLDRPEVGRALNGLKPALMTAGVWADNTVASERVRQILANEPHG